jgi:hypothetical protein
MSKQVIKGAVICCALIMAVVVPGFAQLPGTRISAMIPFDFMVRGKSLPAGKYEVRRVNDSPETLMIQNVRTRQTAMFETDPLEARKTPSQGKIVFHRYGDDYFLSQVWTPGEDTGRELLPSHRERQEQLARNNVPPDTVAVAVY